MANLRRFARAKRSRGAPTTAGRSAPGLDDSRALLAEMTRFVEVHRDHVMLARRGEHVDCPVRMALVDRQVWEVRAARDLGHEVAASPLTD